MTRTLIVLSLVLPFATTALAAQPGPAGVFSGTYDLACDGAALDLHLALAGGNGTTQGSWNDATTVVLDCDGLDADEEAALAEALTDRCAATGLPLPACTTLGDDLAAAVAAFNDATVGLLPTSVQMHVGSYGWFWSGLGGLYPMTGAHEFPDGSTRTLTYLLDNNAGQRGHFATAGITVNAAGASNLLACVDAGVGAVDGRIDAATGDLAADAAVDRSLYCLATDGTAWIAGNVGITYDASFSGSKR